jgi:ketosteroid isomerase-like protein
MLTLQEISDRLEIEDVLARYSHAIDRHDWSRLDDVFTPDATIDYTEFGGPRAALAEIKVFLQKVLPMHAGHYHLVATSLITVEGDSAEAHSVCHNPMVLDRGDGRAHVYVCGLWYHDLLVRTEVGWRIHERREEKCFLWDPEALHTPGVRLAPQPGTG